MNELRLNLLECLEGNSRMELETLAKILQVSEEEVQKEIKAMEDEKVILQYTTLINWEKIRSQQSCTAMIDVKVTPKRGVGFDEIAERIYRYEEVKAVYLMSGAYDLSVLVEGENLNEIAKFVSDKLSTLDSVLSTTTHFLLKKYKHDGTIFQQTQTDKRIVVTP